MRERDIDMCDIPDESAVRRESLSTVSLLAGGLAHEIGNTLTALLEHMSALSELLSVGSSPAVHEELAGATEAARHITAVVRDVRALLRADQRPASIDARAAVERAVRLARPRALGTALLRPGLTQVPRVRGSEASLTQIALNLILNAIEACRVAGTPPRPVARDPGSRPPRASPAVTRIGNVDVHLRRHGESVVLEVSDDGVGMEEHLAEQLFQPVVAGIARPAPGLGLSITRQLVAAMGGVMEFRSRPGGGSTICVKLPVASDLP
jgi:two-component system, NtrC family, sensor kinase